MPHINIKHLLILCTTIVLMVTKSGFAYYDISDTKDKFHFKYERTASKWGKGERTFVLYDNFSHFSKTLYMEQLIFPNSDNFIPADQIPFNIPLRIIIRKSWTVDNAMANLLYANLKLKKLLDEYEALHKQSFKVIQESKTNKATVKFFTQNINSAPSVHNRWKKLTRSRRSSETKNRPLATLPSIKESSVQVDNRSEEIIVAKTEGEHIELKQQNIIKGNSGAVLENNRISVPKYAHNQNSGAKSSDVSNEQRPKRIQRNDASQPWLVHFFSNIVKYTIENKLESFIYLICFLLISSVLSSVFRR